MGTRTVFGSSGPKILGVKDMKEAIATTYKAVAMALKNAVLIILFIKFKLTIYKYLRTLSPRR